jgi:hypothetical protein
MAKKPSGPSESQQESKAPSSLSLWLEDAVPGWLLPLALVTVVVGGGALYIFDLIPERFTALVLAGGVAIGGAGYVTRDLSSGARNQLGRAASLAAGVVIFGLTLVPAIMVIVPGEPLATGSFKAEGEKIKLPPGVDGRVRLLVHGRLGGAGEATLSFDLKAGDTTIPGKLERTQSNVRAGRRGTSTVSHEHNSDFLSAAIPAGVSELTLTRLEGNLAGELEIQIFRDHWPVSLDAIMALLALAVVAALAARQNVKSSATAIAGLALGFGLLVEVLATPDVAVRAQIGALILAAIGGSVVGTVFNSLAKRFVPKAG